MALTKIMLGTLYMDGVKVDTTTTKQYSENAMLEIKNSSDMEPSRIEWIPIENGAKHYWIATRNLLNNISYLDLNKQGLINGILITLNGVKYILRVLSGGNSERINGNKYSLGSPSINEWDKYICNELNLTNMPIPNARDLAGDYTLVNIPTSDSNNAVNWYGVSSICQDKNGNTITIRGNNSVGYFDTSDINYKSMNLLGWRPILELYNEPPSISGSDINLGNYSSYIRKQYQIYDGDNDLLKLTEKVDGVTIRELENRSNGDSFILDLKNVWDGLTYSTHTIEINVQDGLENKALRKWTFTKVKETGGYTTTLVKPVISTYRESGVINPVNAKLDNIIEFKSTGGDLVYANELQITDNLTNIIVYQRKDLTFDPFHNIPRGMLENGKEYQLRIRTYNSKNQYSIWSEVVLMRALSPINIIITNIVDGMIASQNPMFKADYSQDEGEVLRTYKYILYKDGVEVGHSDELTDGNLSYQFNNLENKTYYEIVLLMQTLNNLVTEFRQEFYCEYYQKRMSAVIKLDNNSREGCINIKTDVRQIIGHVISGDEVYYINGDEADLHNSVVQYDIDSPFLVSGDWTLKMWARDLEDNVMIINISSEYGYIQLEKHGNMFVISKYIQGELFYQKIAFVKGDIEVTDGLYFFVQCESSTGLMNFDVKRTNGGKYTWFTPSHDDDVTPNKSNVENGYNAYDLTDGFMTILGHDFRNILISNLIDGKTSKIYIPSVEELTPNSGECFEYFSNGGSIQSIITQSAINSNDNNDLELIKGQFHSYFTRSINSNRELIIIDDKGQFGVVTPYRSDIGIRIVVNVPNKIVASQYKDKDGCYNISTDTTGTKNIYDTQLLLNLNLGDRVKDVTNVFYNEVIKFTIVDRNKLNNSITLMSDIIAIKPYDAVEPNNPKGNTNWNLSNLRQWLNSNDKLAK